MSRTPIALVVALTVAVTAAGGASLLGAPAAAASVTTIASDTLRTGWYPDEAALRPSVVQNQFGQVWSAGVDGQVYAQPVVAGGVVVVVTETNHVYGIDQTTGAPRWTRADLGPPWNPSDLGCGDLTPSVGITGTPVVDPSTNTAYFFAKSYATGTSGAAVYLAHAVDAATGAERPGYPVSIAGSASNDPSDAFDPQHQLQRTGLLLLNGVVVAEHFFSSAPVVGLADGLVFPDALAGGVHVGLRGGPLLLVDPNALPSPVQSYLASQKGIIAAGYVYGGVVEVSDGVLTAVQAALT